MKDCSPSPALIIKGDKFSLDQCLINDVELEQMKNISYALDVGSLMYAQVCTKTDITYVVRMLGQYQSNQGTDHWKVAKKVMKYLMGIKNYMLMYRHTDNLEVIGYPNADFTSCMDSGKSTSGYVFMLANRVVF